MIGFVVFIPFWITIIYFKLKKPNVKIGDKMKCL